jgi:DNA-directed RNA polymerase sigma subunit (sigma70/sigma32)
LAAEEPLSLGDLGARFGVSKQRMGQIADKLKQRFRAQIEAELGPEFRAAWLSERQDADASS